MQIIPFFFAFLFARYVNATSLSDLRDQLTQCLQSECSIPLTGDPFLDCLKNQGCYTSNAGSSEITRDAFRVMFSICYDTCDSYANPTQLTCSNGCLDSTANGTAQKTNDRSSGTGFDYVTLLIALSVVVAILIGAAILVRIANKRKQRTAVLAREKAAQLSTMQRPNTASTSGTATLPVTNVPFFNQKIAPLGVPCDDDPGQGQWALALNLEQENNVNDDLVDVFATETEIGKGSAQKGDYYAGVGVDASYKKSQPNSDNLSGKNPNVAESTTKTNVGVPKITSILIADEITLKEEVGGLISPQSLAGTAASFTGWRKYRKLARQSGGVPGGYRVGATRENFGSIDYNNQEQAILSKPMTSRIGSMGMLPQDHQLIIEGNNHELSTVVEHKDARNKSKKRRNKSDVRMLKM